MKIEKNNGEIINSMAISIHDDIVAEFQFDREKRILSLLLEYYQPDVHKRRLSFRNVVGFEMTSCDFWGPSQRIFEFNYMRPADQTLLPRLFETKRLNQPEPLCKLTAADNYMETVILFVSGDKLTTVCEYIVIEDVQ